MYLELHDLEAKPGDPDRTIWAGDAPCLPREGEYMHVSPHTPLFRVARVVWLFGGDTVRAFAELRRVTSEDELGRAMARANRQQAKQGSLFRRV